MRPVGPGKTFTMNGNDQLPGLVPRAIAIFEDSEGTNNYQHESSSR